MTLSPVAEIVRPGSGALHKRLRVYPRMNRSGAGTRRLCTAMVLLAVWAATAVPAEASNEALLRLLQVLRDHGSITAAEYEEIRKVASMPEPAAPEARVARRTTSGGSGEGTFR